MSKKRVILRRELYESEPTSMLAYDMLYGQEPTGAKGGFSDAGLAFIEAHSISYLCMP
jgi:hypothetical protein